MHSSSWRRTQRTSCVTTTSHCALPLGTWCSASSKSSDILSLDSLTSVWLHTAWWWSSGSVMVSSEHWEVTEATKVISGLRKNRSSLKHERDASQGRRSSQVNTVLHWFLEAGHVLYSTNDITLCSTLPTPEPLKNPHLHYIQKESYYIALYINL